MTTTASHADLSQPARPLVRDLDDLLALDAPALERLYREASTPAIGDLDGDLIGRMLVGPSAPPALADVMRRLAKWRAFPWLGKTFRSRDTRSGEGWNRVLSDRNLWFRFTTSVGRSRAGDFDAVHLDYDHPENPFFIRAIQDEVRAVAPGLFLGQAWLVVRGRPWLALYFALRSPAATR